MKIILLLIALNFASFSTSSAHVGLNYPIGDEEFKAGTTINIRWYIAIDHGECSWNIYFSPDNGYSWTTVAENLSKSQLEYLWTIPEVSTASAKIKIIQNNYIGIKYETESGNFKISAVTAGIPSEVNELNKYSLCPAYPNPFNSSTRITFNLPQDEQVQLTIYNIAGEKITSLLNEDISAGLHSIDWNAGGLTTGVYLYSIQTRNFSQTRKVILIK